MRTLPYRRREALDYAHKWAFGRNTKYYDFSAIGGDCTNYASQCLHTGCGVMNYTETFGWYYSSSARRSPAWTGVQYFYNFITKNKGLGPFGHEGSVLDVTPGDFVQLSFDGREFAHTPIVVATPDTTKPEGILVAAHTNDSDWRPLSTYDFKKIRGIIIDGYRAK